MDLSYRGNDHLARVASTLECTRALPCSLPPYIFMTDPERTPNVLRCAARLPNGSAVIYRHFGAADKYNIATALRQICFVNDVKFLIAQDEGLAREVGADGLHLPEKYLSAAKKLRARYPNWILSGAVHSTFSLNHTNGLDAAILSPVFNSESVSAGTALGVDKFRGIVARAPLPIFALGGINNITAPQLLGSGAAGIAGVSAFAGKA